MDGLLEEVVVLVRWGQLLTGVSVTQAYSGHLIKTLNKQTTTKNCSNWHMLRNECISQCVVQCTHICYILSTKLHTLTAKWGHFARPHNFKGPFEGYDIVLRLRLELALG